MRSISVEELLIWKKKQLTKGGDHQSLTFLLDSVGGITNNNLNLSRINSQDNLYLKENLDYLESIWENHLLSSSPIQYLCGKTYWRDLKLIVTDKVLIPRPETELIIDIVLKIFGNKTQKLFFAELGTGSGAISIALALKYPSWQGVATDIDKDALAIAATNYVNSSGQSNLKFYCGHWWTPFESFKGKLDLAISNPPYIPDDNFEQAASALIEASLIVKGTVNVDERAPGGHELVVSSVEVIGAVREDSPFPITESAMNAADGGETEFLLDNRHLYLRTRCIHPRLFSLCLPCSTSH